MQAKIIQVPVTFNLEIDIQQQMDRIHATIEDQVNKKFESIMLEVRNQVNGVSDWCMQENSHKIKDRIDKEINFQVNEYVRNIFIKVDVEKSIRKAVKDAIAESVKDAIANKTE